MCLWDYSHLIYFKIDAFSGYMPPVYVTRGHFSMKSDVFSFGVVVLEIVSGKRNRQFSDPKHFLNLVGHVSISI